MFSNERSSYRQGSGNSWHHPAQNPNGQPKPPVREDSLKSGQVQIERKLFVFSLKENPRGRLLRITEDLSGRYNSIIVPATGLGEFRALLEEMIQASESLPPAQTP